MYRTEGIGAAATARPNPRPRSRPRLIFTSRQIQRPEALRCAPLDTFLQVRAMARYRGPRVAHKEKCMARHKKSIPQHPRSFPPLLSDVLAYWRWYGERAAGTALPEIYQQFVQKIASSKVLQRLCSDQLHELKWRHALREQLGAMWEQIRYPQRTIKKLSKARPAHFAGDFTFYMCGLCSSHNSAASTTCPPWTARVWSAPSSNGWRT